MTITIRVTETVRTWLGEGVIAERNPSVRYDVTLVAPCDFGPWVDNAHMRLRPHIVRNPSEAREVYDYYEQLRRNSGP